MKDKLIEALEWKLIQIQNIIDHMIETIHTTNDLIQKADVSCDMEDLIETFDATCDTNEIMQKVDVTCDTQGMI
jgi:hypothetical protein